MKTANDFVQDFLFKDKPKKSYCKKFDAKDLEKLLNDFLKYNVEQAKKATNTDL